MQDPASGGPRGPGSHDQIPPNKPPWFDQPHPVAPWGQQQVLSAVLKGDVEGGGTSPIQKDHLGSASVLKSWECYQSRYKSKAFSFSAQLKAKFISGCQLLHFSM